jgi:hypothetical protein
MGLSVHMRLSITWGRTKHAGSTAVHGHSGAASDSTIHNRIRSLQKNSKGNKFLIEQIRWSEVTIRNIQIPIWCSRGYADRGIKVLNSDARWKTTLFYKCCYNQADFRSNAAWLKLFIGRKMAVFWVVVPCSLAEVYQRFRGPCCLHHQGFHRPTRR